MGTLGTLDSRLLTDAAHPLVRARRRIAGLAGLPTLESARIDVVAAAEQRSEEANLRLGRSRLVDDAQVHPSRQSSTLS